eukprot:5804909-Alexandrium_andersonii.AAC.1
MAKDCVDCGSEDCRLEPAMFADSRLQTPSRPEFVGGFGICEENGTERTSRELRGPTLRPFPGPRGS